jgi:hypothetical protein
MNEEFDIPKHGGAGVAFLGVEFDDSIVTILGVFLGLGLGIKYGALAAIGMSAGAFMLNKAYLDWREGLPAGHLRSTLFQLGLYGYSCAFRSADVVFMGDGVVINPANAQLVDRMEAQVIAALAQAQKSSAKPTNRPATHGANAQSSAHVLQTSGVGHGT